MAAGRDRAYRKRAGLETRAETEQKQGDEIGPGAERIRSSTSSRRGTDARLEFEQTRTIAEEDDRPPYSASSDKAMGKYKAQAKDSGYQRDGRTRAEMTEPRPLGRSSRQRSSITEKPRDEPNPEYEANPIGSGYEGRSASRTKWKARKPEPVVPKRETRRSISENDDRENLENDTRSEYARKAILKEPSEPLGREGKADKATDEIRERGERREREPSAVVKEMKTATESKEPPVSTKEGPAKQVSEEKGPDKTPAVVAEGVLDDEDKYSTDSEDYYEEVTEEVLEPDPNDWRRGRSGVITRRTTRSTSKKRKYAKPNARKSSPQPSSKHKTTTTSEKKQRDDEIDSEKKNETTTSDADDSFPPAQDGEEKETGTCPCCGSCWPSHMDESRMKAAQGQSRIWRRRLRRGDEGPAGDEWYEVRNFGPKQNLRFKRKTDNADKAGGGLQGSVQFTERMPSPNAPSSASPPPYSAPQLYSPAVQGQDVYFSAYQPNLQSPYQRPQQPLFPAPMAFPQPYPMPPAAMMGAYCGAVQANSATAFPAATSGFCATCRAQAHSGQLSYPFGGGQPGPTMSVEDFLRREQRVRQEERLRQEEKQLREEKLRREERLRQEERLRREQRARKEERRRRELEEERLRQEERLRLEERIREEQRLSLEARLEQQRRERLERQRRERLEEQRRYNDSLRRALAEQRMAIDRGAAVPPSGFLDEVLIRARLRPAPSSVPSRMGLQDGLRTSSLRDLLLRESERPAASMRGTSRPVRWEDVHRYTEKAGDPRDGWGPPSRGGGRFR
ncbi:MAP7 domain-containing protein 1-like [Dermacentor silvarum]|uniref:MAP7 domain-containing protein 1-like n=1 Tax=Dermacentor silvarum TaxID=543639 RepID=UPI00189A6A8A|nr:MAP7 domain-containing protein 1-like [Dermacentor silvarum]